VPPSFCTKNNLVNCLIWTDGICVSWSLSRICCKMLTRHVPGHYLDYVSCILFWRHSCCIQNTGTNLYLWLTPLQAWLEVPQECTVYSIEAGMCIGFGYVGCSVWWFVVYVYHLNWCSSCEGLGWIFWGWNGEPKWWATEVFLRAI
jgi:hypothetical protein